MRTSLLRSRSQCPSRCSKAIPSSADAVPSRRLTIALFVVALAAGPAFAQTTAADLKTQIASLGALDYAVRTRAARQIRRAAEPDAVAALTDAVRTSKD